MKTGHKGSAAVVTLKAPYNHVQSKWTVNGVAQDKRGNECTAARGDAVVARSAKGEFGGVV